MTKATEWPLWWLTALAWALLGAPALAQTSEPPEPPPLTSLRYDEDYSYLRDPAVRSGAWWEPSKYVPLDPSGAAYLTFGNEVRLRYERYWNNEFGGAPKTHDGYLWARALPYADLHLGPNVRLFGQFIAAYATGVEPRRSPVDETGLDLLQGFAEVRLQLDGENAMSLRGGRQVLRYGSERLIGVRYGPNVLQSFDGVLARFSSGGWRVDGFFMRPVENRLHGFDDRTDASRKLWALYATGALPSVSPGSGLDLYYIGFENEAARYDQGAGPETRHTLGSRLFGSNGGWRWDLEGFFQFGRFDGRDIRAWSAASDVRYTFADRRLRPYLGLRANLISGDDDRNDRDLQSFNALFPRGKYFGEIGLIGPRNLINLHPIAGVDLGSGWSLSGGAVFYWRESLGDGVYGNPGNLLRSAESSRARYIGTQADVVFAWEASRTLSFEFAYSMFQPGRFIHDTGQAKIVHFFGAEVKHQF